MILFTILSTAVAIKILREYKVNYIFIFELDPNYKITYTQLIRVFLTLLTIWGLGLLGQILIIKLDYIFPEPTAAGFTLAVLLIFICLCFAPLHCFYMRARLDLVKVLWNIIISPFGIVRFKHFFIADILTSFVIPLKDLGFMSCFFFGTKWLSSILPLDNE
jgi:hypothetical protein